MNTNSINNLILKDDLSKQFEEKDWPRKQRQVLLSGGTLIYLQKKDIVHTNPVTYNLYITYMLIIVHILGPTQQRFIHFPCKILDLVAT